MDRFEPYSRRNPCPICDGGSDCRYISESDLVLCHGFTDLDSGHPDWAFSKTADSGVWGVHYRRRDERFDRSQWLERKAERELKARREKEARALDSLPIEERDRAIRSLSSYIGLSGRHKQALIDRGLTDSQIEAGLFFSIDPGDRVPAGTPANLAGVVNGKIAASHSGYACIAFDRHGRATGWQVRLDSAEDGNKYRWAKGTHSSHLPNGELPITFIYPEIEIRSTLGCCEGILKPRIAANRWGQRMFGASGGYLRGKNASGEQVIEIVAAEKAKLGLADGEPLPIDLYPDAGDALNPHVLKRWKEQVGFLRSIGCDPWFVWWGQFDKTDHDCDEVTPEEIEGSRLITPESFDRISYRERTRRAWKESKTFTPSETVDQEWVRIDFELGTISLANAELGRGKTQNLIRFIDENRSWLENKSLIIPGYRNSLLYQTIERINATRTVGKRLMFHIESSQVSDSYLAGIPWVAGCLDSMHRIPLEALDGSVVVIDEVVSVLKHLLFSKTAIAEIREKIVDWFVEAIKRASLVICLDGNLADWVVRFFEGIESGKEIKTIKNIYRGAPKKINFLTGSDVGNFMSPNLKHVYVENILDSDRPVAVYADSQIFLETLDKTLSEKGKNTLRVDSKTASEPRVREFLRNPDDWIMRNRPDAILLSPTAESGLDISIRGYFGSVYGFLFGQLDADGAVQFTFRVRDPAIERFLWVIGTPVKHDESRFPAFPVDVKKLFSDRLSLDLERAMRGAIDGGEVISNIKKMFDSVHPAIAKAAYTIRAFQNYEAMNLRESVRSLLKSRGHEVIEKIGEYASPDLFNATKREVQLKECEDIFNAPKKEGDFRSRKTTWIGQCSEIKSSYLYRLPGIEDKPEWSSKFLFHVRFEEKERVSQKGKVTRHGKINPIDKISNYHLLTNPEIARENASRKFSRMKEKADAGGKEFLWLYKNLEATIHALKRSGIEKLVGSDEFYREDSPLIQEILKNCRSKSVSLALGTPGKRSAIQFIGSILARIGYEWECHSRKENGRTVRYYRCIADGAVWNSPFTVAIQECTIARWEKFMTDKPETARGITEKIPLFEITSKLDRDRVLAVAPEDNIYIKNIGLRCNPIAGENSSECTTSDPIELPRTHSRTYTRPAPLADLYECGRGEVGDFPEPDITDLAAMIVSLSLDDGDCWEFLRTFPPRAIYLAIEAIESGRESIVPPRKATLARAG